MIEFMHYKSDFTLFLSEIVYRLFSIMFIVNISSILVRFHYSYSKTSLDYGISRSYFNFFHQCNLIMQVFDKKELFMIIYPILRKIITFKLGFTY